MTLPPELVKIIVERLTLVPLFKLRTTSRLLNQACQGHIERRRREVEIGVLDSLFDIIHDAQEADLQTLWPEISTIREQAKNILSLIEVTFHEHQDPDNPIQIIGDLEQIWNDIITEAFRARDAPSRSELCRAARWLIQATREVETVLRPQVADVTREVSVDFAAGINAASTIFDPPAMATLAPWEEESAVLTAPTRSGPTGTRSKESVTTDTRAIVAEAVDLPETMPGGDLLTQQQEFEHQLQESKSEKSGDSIRTAAALHKLGNVLAQTGDLKQAMRYLQESLQMQRSLHGDGDHPGIAATLQELGNVLAQTGDLKQAMRYLQESLQMERSLHGDGDHPGIAASLHELGNVLAKTGDLKQAMRYLQESLQMQRSLHGDGVHPGIAATLHELGNVLAKTGDLKQAMRYLQESLQMERSLHGDGDHPGIAATLHKLGDVLGQTGDLKQAMRYLQESLQMQRSLHGDGDHPGIAVTLHELGNVLAKTGALKQAMRYLQESLQMKRSLHGDGDHPGIAATLHKLGNVLAQTGDLKQAMRYWQEFLQMAARCH